MRALILIASFLLVSQTSTADSTSISTKKLTNFYNELEDLIGQGDILEDFWSGDDGVDCGEPNFTINSIDFKNSIIHLDVWQNFSAHGCIEPSFKCQLPYFIKDDKLSVSKLDPTNDCE